MQTILESIEHLSQISSKSIFITSSYTVSELVHFLDTVYILMFTTDIT